MTFINWYILFGMFAVAIPIIIHLFNRRKAKVVDWGAMQFLLGSLVNRKRRILVEELILMALRCMLVAVLVLAIARPFSPVNSGMSWLILLPVILFAAILIAVSTIVARTRSFRWIAYLCGFGLIVGVIYLSQNQYLLQSQRWKSGTEQDIAFVIDGSSSMRIHVDGKMNFERAVHEARLLVESLGPDDTISVIVAGGVAETVTPEPVSVRGNTEDVFDKLEPVGGAFSVVDALSAAASALATGSNASKKIVLISDGQNVGWQEDNRGQWEFVSDTFDHLTTKPKVVSRFLSLPDRFQNATVSSVELSRALIGTDREVTILVRVENTGFETIEPSGLQLRLAGDKVLTADVGTIEPGESAQLNFKHRFEKNGAHEVEAKLLINDDLDEDNQQIRIVQILDTLPVLLVDGSAQVRNVDQATSFIEIALSPPADEPEANEAPPLVSATVVAAPDVNESIQFADYRVVMLVDVPRLGATTATRLADYVRQGGGLLIAPGKRSEAAFYNEWQTTDGKKVLPAQLARRIIIDGEKQATRPVEDSFKHPSLVRLASASQSDISKAAVVAYWQQVPPENNPDVVVGARLDGGDPFLVQQSFGRGLVAVTSTSLDGNGSDLPSLVSFLPFMHELTYDLASPTIFELNREPANVLSIDLPNAGELQMTPDGIDNLDLESVVVSFPSGKTRKATLENRGAHSVVSLSGAVEPGVYRINLDGDKSNRFAAAAIKKDGDQSYVPFVVKLSEIESRLVPLSDDQESVAERYLDYFRSANIEQMIAAVIGDVPGHELWKYLIIGAVVIVLAESFVTRWIAQQRKMGTTEAVDFISEGERLSTFQDRARELLETVRTK